MNSVALFDLPNAEFGALSLGKLRHAQLSPYSWSPSYIIGSSHADLHAPYDATAYPIAAEKNAGSLPSGTQWDLLIGASDPGPYEHGPRSWTPKSHELLQTGYNAENVSVNGQNISTNEEILAYDITFETNQNLWDSFFISGLKLNSEGAEFIKNPLNEANLQNARYCYNTELTKSQESLESLLASSQGLENAFWNAGYMLKNKAAFNINSTSIPAWTAFLSGIRGIERPLRDGGTEGDSAQSVFSRFETPSSASSSDSVSPDTPAGWQGGRILSDAEIATLATAIVKEVKTRGPFISLADMVNRRLMPEENNSPAPESQRGAIEAAIFSTNLNENFMPKRNLTSTPSTNPWVASTNSSKDFNKTEFQHDYAKRQDPAKTWGAPGYLTQGDILEPLAPAMTVRGDTFTIRCYGESREGDKIKAVAYIEAVVYRTPEYMEAADLGSSPSNNNLPTDPTDIIDYATGEKAPATLTPGNLEYGRKFKVKSVKWLSPSEV